MIRLDSMRTLHDRKRWIERNLCGIRRLYGDCRVYGPYKRKSDGRFIVTLRGDGRNRTRQFSRLALEVALGRRIPKKYDVHHKDRDHGNDDIRNLQLVFRKDHARLDAIRAVSSVCCVYCGTSFELSKGQREKRSMRKYGPFCSKQCAGKYGSSVQNGAERKDRSPVVITYRRYTLA